MFVLIPQKSLLSLLFIIVILLDLAACVVDFDACLENARQGIYGLSGGTDNHGHLVANISDATALTYDTCVKACGAAQVPFEWDVFFQRFSQWLLPWLALISQLPYGAADKLDNIESVLLTVGSPTLAAYSLALTVLNGRWIARRFSNYHWPNVQHVVRVLTSLQQAPLKMDNKNGILASLIILPHNDEWWQELFLWVNYAHAWSISAIISIAWVVIAYVFTVIDSFAGNIMTTIPSNGQGIGTIWIWLLPIVIGWLQVAPKCDRSRLREAITRANNIAWVAVPHGAPVLSEYKAISLQWTKDYDFDVHADEQCTAPLYNYARFFTWTQAVEDIASILRATTERSHEHQSVDPEVPWLPSNQIQSANRIGTFDQVNHYSIPITRIPCTPYSDWGSDVLSRMVTASILALMLSWGTTGAALVVGWFTYTYGLGCRAGSYLLYGVLSTISWMLLIASSILAHRSKLTSRQCTDLEGLRRIRGRSGFVAISLRRVGKGIAIFNAVWVVVACLFQFSNFYNRCFCNSSYFSLWDKAYVVIKISGDDAIAYRNAWLGGVSLGGSTAFVFTAFVGLLVNPPMPE